MHPKCLWSQDAYGNWGYGLYTQPDLYEQFKQVYTNQNGTAGARISSNSWGQNVEDDGVGGTIDVKGKYRSDCVSVDQFMFDHPDMLILFSAGNDGIDSDGDGVVDLNSIGVPGTAKNCLTVGASENERPNIRATWGDGWPSDFPKEPLASDLLAAPKQGSLGIAAFSSRGPCEGGRIKPDIVAPGTLVLSMLSSMMEVDTWGAYDKYYHYMGGTSMSTPLVAGSAALVREWLQKKRNISNPDGATIKAILLAGAKTLAPGQYGTGKYQEIPNLYPNNVEGWGQVNLGKSLQNSIGLLVYDGKVIEHGRAHTFKVKATVGNALNIVMAYTDAPGDPSSATALVNDLDLLVKTPNGKLIYPNSRTSPDTVNNVEGVRIAAGNVESGTYTITVTGTSIPQGMNTSLTGGKGNATRYSLVVNGAKEKSTPAEPPSNDDVANANTISLQSGSTTGSNIAATQDNGNIGGLASVWWKWTPSKSGTATFDTEGSAFDTTLMVYTKYANGTYRLEKENNDATTTVSWSRVAFEVASGTTYYIAVGGSSGKTGNIKMNWDLQVVQKPDLCFALGTNNSTWPAALFLSGTRGSATKTTAFKNKQAIYAYLSFKNNGNVSMKSGFVALHEILKAGAVVQSQLGADDHEGIGNIVARVSEESQLAPLELAELLPRGQHIRQHLGGVEVVGQTVPHRHAGVAGQILHHRLLVAPVLDAVVQPSQHLGRVRQGLLLAHLG